MDAVGAGLVAPVRSALDADREGMLRLPLDPAGNCLLHVAAGQPGGSDELFGLVLAAAVAGGGLESRNLAGCTALHCAAVRGQAVAAAALLDAGADLEAHDSFGSTPLLLAAGGGAPAAHELAALLLARGADVTVSDGCGRNALLLACEAPTGADFAATLLAASPDPAAMCALVDRDERNALIAAVDHGRVPAMGVVLRAAPALLESRDAGGCTPLISAAARGHATVVEALVQAGAAIDARDNRGATAAWWASASSQRDALAVLVDAGADLTVPDVREGTTPLEAAIAAGAYSVYGVFRGTALAEQVPADPVPAYARHGNHTPFVVPAGAALVPASLAELEQAAAATGGVLYPRRLLVSFAGEESFGDGVVRQWLGQLGRALLQPTPPVEADRPARYELTVGCGGDTVATSRGDRVDQLLLERGRPCLLECPPGAGVSLGSCRSDAFEIAPTPTGCTLTASAVAPAAAELNLRGAEGQAVTVRVAGPGLIFSRTHGAVPPERAQLVHSPDQEHASLNPDAALPACAPLLRGLGRCLGLAVARRCPLGVRISPALARALCESPPEDDAGELRAAMPPLQFELLEGFALSPERPEARRAEDLGLWLDALPDRFRYLPDGEAEVTLANAAEYAEWLARQLRQDVQKQTAEVLRGFREVQGAREAVGSLGGWRGLQNSLYGSPAIDVAEWQEATRAGGGDPRTVELFWQGVARLGDEERRALLWFWTSESPPAGGLFHLDRKPALSVSAPGTLPVAATCFYSLAVPRCREAAEMDEVLKLCVAHRTQWGFA